MIRKSEMIAFILWSISCMLVGWFLCSLIENAEWQLDWVFWAKLFRTMWGNG